MKTTSFLAAQREYDAMLPPEDDPRHAWCEHLQELSDAELESIGAMDDRWGVNSIADDPDWRAEVWRRAQEIGLDPFQP